MVFRGEDGEARVFDAHCPHFGAHLGHGGKVEGKGLRCPFHAWRFNGDGLCDHIPYAKRIPAKAGVRAWPVCERNGVIFVYHDDKQESPAYEIPVLSEIGSGEWSAPENRFWNVRSRWLDMNENAIDNVHFKYIHGTPTIPTARVIVDGHIFRVVNDMQMTTPKGVILSLIHI